MSPLKVLLAASIGAAPLAACATTSTGVPTPPAGAEVSSGQDCAVFAAIAREHYRFAENAPPPLWATVEEEDGRYFVQCDWPRLGVPMSGETYDPDRATPGRFSWVKFERPRYLGTRALVATGIMHGPLAGMGYECEVVSGIAGWTVTNCRNTWVS